MDTTTTPAASKRKKPSTSPANEADVSDESVVIDLVCTLTLRTMEWIQERTQHGPLDIVNTMALNKMMADTVRQMQAGINTAHKMGRGKDNLIAEQQQEIKSLRDQIQRLEQVESNRQLDSTSAPSFADIAARGARATATKTRPHAPQLSTVVRSAGLSGKDVAKKAIGSIGSKQAQLKAQVQVIGEGAARITCGTKDQLEQVKKLVQEEGLDTQDRQLLRPQVRIHGLDPTVGTVDSSDLLATISKLNDLDLDPRCKVVASNKNWRDKDKVDVVIETDGRSQQLLLQAGHLLVGFERCRVTEHLRLRQCLKCLGLGHKRDQCKACDRCLRTACTSRTCKPRQICLRCAGDHLRKDCPSSATTRCSVCLHHGQVIRGHHTKDHADHMMLGRDCPFKEIGEQQMRRRTDYE